MGILCQSIIGYDCNGLYYYAIKQPMLSEESHKTS